MQWYGGSIDREIFHRVDLDDDIDGGLQAQACIHISSCEAKSGELARVVEHHHLAGEEAVDVLCACIFECMNGYSYKLSIDRKIIAQRQLPAAVSC